MTGGRPAFARRAAAEDGFLTTQFVLAVGLTLLLVVMVANLVVFSYGRGVVRAALDEGVRAGSRVTASALTCEQRAREVLGDLLGGTMGRDVAVSCGQTPERVVADADVRFAGWLPAVPDWRFSVTASARRRGEPTP